MLAYKGFDKGLKCRGYQFKPFEENVCAEAHCARRGFHAAENPLDTFTYYRDTDSSEYWLVKCEGDIHEDGNDSKISCTSLTPIRPLSLKEMAAAALLYIQKYPNRHFTGVSDSYETTEFKLLKSSNPILKGKKGQCLGFAKKKGNVVENIGIIFIDGEIFKEDVFYNIEGNEVKKNGELL